ncbi:MAG: 1-deoxy-D-xylulose-5-phosphate reductoisomerase, partial [Planctomycetota bacterium]|nr:1-deoxy-D-xylulose-5-phosphate reductoisomerase [Planctomycetota bacterium]
MDAGDKRRKNIVLLGATGSIGRSTLDVLRRFPDRFRLIGAAACSNAEEMAKLIAEFAVPRAAMFREDRAAELRAMVNGRCEVFSGAEGVAHLAGDPEADTVVSAIVGAAGLVPTLRAIEGGKRVAIANKEPLVMAGAIMRAAADRHGAEILPIDSEHSAIFQAMRSGGRGEVRRILLTASGGPFRDAPRETMARATAKEALNHPTWNMGAKITIDSATLMNKALEIIEA